MKNTSKRERRLNSAKNWIKTYSGKNVVKGYSKKYSVDKLSAVKELRMIGVKITKEYEIQLVNSLKALKHKRLSSKRKQSVDLCHYLSFESDEYFAMILGYTKGGFAYGLTHKENKEINTDE